MPTDEELNALPMGKRFSCVCGGFEASEEICGMDPAKAQQPATIFLMSYVNGTTLLGEGTEGDVLRVDEYAGTPLQDISNVPPEAWARYDYAYPGVFEANFTGCHIEQGECKSTTWGKPKPEACVTFSCDGGKVDCPPKDVPKCPGWNIFTGCGDCKEPECNSTKTYKYWQHHCSVASTPLSDEPSTLECELEPSTADGGFRCIYSQFAVLGMTCHVGNCLYDNAPPAPVPPAPPPPSHHSATDTVALYGFGAMLAAAAAGALLLRPLGRGWHNRAEARHAREAAELTEEEGDMPLGEMGPAAALGATALPTAKLFDTVAALSWHDLSYAPRTRLGDGHSCVLCGVSGVAAHTAADSSGVCAVLGPSGAGKTTLLDILSGRLCGSAVGGEVRVNGCLAGPAALRSVSGYVPQQDVLPATSTVLEYLLFHAALRLPRCVDRAQRERRVWAILSRLGLQRIARSTIGSVEHRGLSGGERRRVSIAVELLSQPGLLFLDEPTSGLDSSNSRRVLDILCALGSGGVTCVLSIHQPRADAFRAFDRVLVLTGDGRMAYSGSSRELEAHFGALGYTPRGAHEHVIDRVLDALVNGSEGVIDSVVAAQAASGALQADYEALCCGEEPALVARSALGGGVRRLPRSRARVTRRFALLFLRAAVDAVRDPFHIVLNYGAAAAAALGLGLLYRDAGYETAGMQDRLGAFFFLLVFVSLLTMGSVPSWHGSRRVFLHERASSVYGTTEYLAAGLLVDIVLLRVLPSWFFVALMYRPMGLSDDPGHLATFAAILILANATASVVCMAVTCAMASARSANLVMSNVFIVLFMFGGFLLNKDTLPPLVRWLGHVSFVNYAFELLAINEFHGTPAMWTFTVPNTTEPGDKPLPPLTVDGDSVLRQFGMYPQRWTLDFWLLGAIVAACVLLAYAQLLLARDGELELSLSLLAWFRPVAKNGGTKNLRGADSVDALTNAAREVESDGADADDEMETPLLASAESPRAFHRGAFSVTIDSGSSANHLSWTGLDYSVQTVRGWRNVLCGVSGVAAHTAADSSGVCAVLGPSGAGKTTLLDILSGRLCGSAVGGEVRVNGCLAGPAALRSVSGYVPQQDVLPATSTVLEYLLFHAALRLPRCVDRAQRERRVWAILSRLGLQRIARSTIGSVEHRGLSGGERRRVSIAVELLSQPGLLFLDEPTSGLDSSNSRRVLDILCALGSGGVTCVLSIHQPRADAFRAFDRVLVLTGDGRMAYSGSSRELEAHFGALGYTPRGAHEHVIDRVLDALVSGSPGEVEAIATHAAGDFERSVEGKASFRLRESSTDAIAGPEPLLPEGQGARFRAAFGTQLRLLLWRAVNNTLRNPLLLLVNFVVSFIMALVIGLTFQRAGIDSPGIQNRFGCIFFVALYFSLMSLSSLPVWREERQLFAHERAAGCYGTVPYFLSSVLADTLILRLVPPLFFTLSAHFLVDLLPTGVRVAHFTLIVALLNTAAAACGMAIGAACNSAAVANVAGALWILASVLFGGLVLSEREAPKVVKALSHLSYFRYGYESLLINEFHDTEGWHFSSYKAPTELYKVVSGDTILRTFGFDPNGMEGDLVGLAVLLGVAWAITLALLRLRAGSVS